MEGTVTVDNGFLEVDADMRGSGIVLDGSSSVLCGDGRVNGVSGSGRVSPGLRSSGRLTAQSVGGSVDFSFRFTALGESPEGNGRLALLFTEAPFAKVLDGENRVDVYFDAPPPEGGFALGGFETTSPADFTRFVALAEWRFYVSDPEGDVAYEGQRYARCMVPLTVATVAQGTGRILKVSRPSHGYAQWAATYYTIAEQNDPATGGPLAKGADGVENLMRYALGLDRTTPVGPYLPQFTRAGGVLVYAYRRLKAEDSGLDYAVVTTDSLTASPASWQDAFEVDGLDVRLGPALATERPDVEVVTVEIIPTARQPLRFFRLRVTGP